MNLAQTLETLPPRVYLRNGELVIHFSTSGDLVAGDERALNFNLDRDQSWGN
jgi:hypothetical protein